MVQVVWARLPFGGSQLNEITTLVNAGAINL